MKYLFIIDHIDTINPITDTTYPLMREAFVRRTETHIAYIEDLYFTDKVMVKSQKIEFSAQKHYLSDRVETPLDDFSLVFMRKEPPYDLNFHYATNLLSLAKTQVVNSPQALRDFNEKLIILNFPELIPKTLVSSDLDSLKKFTSEQEFSVLKALDSFQGKVVKKLSKEDDLDAIFKEWTKEGSTPVMIQEFLPEIEKGDKRILVLGGNIIGAVNRMPKEGSFLSNFGQGGSGHKTEITESDQKIADTISEFLKLNGLHFVGLDVIGGKLTEINITCPTGLQHINKFNPKEKLEYKVIDYFELLEE